MHCINIVWCCCCCCSYYLFWSINIRINACYKMVKFNSNATECDLHFEHLFYCHTKFSIYSMHRTATNSNVLQFEIKFSLIWQNRNDFSPLCNVCVYILIVWVYMCVCLCRALRCMYIVCTEVIYIFSVYSNTCWCLNTNFHTRLYSSNIKTCTHNAIEINNKNTSCEHDEKEQCNKKMFFELVFCQMSICVHPYLFLSLILCMLFMAIKLTFKLSTHLEMWQMHDKTFLCMRALC